jgi:hypothetical protein
VLLRNRRWDVGLKTAFWLLLTAMLLLSLRNFTYAFANPEPLAVASPADILAGLAPEDRYVALTATPQSERVLPYFRYGIWYYYFPLEGTGGRLYGRDYAPPRTAAPLLLTGRLQRFASVPFAAQVAAAQRATLGEDVPADAWIILQGEAPEAYQVAVYSDLPLVCLWLLNLYLLVRGLQGKPALPGQRGRAGV